MESRRQSNRRREFPRYQAMDRALAMVSEPEASMPYHIIDISKGGLAFRYLGNKMESDEIAELDLYFNDTLCAKGIPVDCVADTWTGSDLTDIRRNCLSFKNLSTDQQEQVNLFIQQYTLGQPQ